MWMPCRSREIGNLRPRNGLLGGGDELAGDRPADPADDPQGRHTDHEPKQRDRGLAQQRSQPARLGGLFERNLQAGDGLGGQSLGRLPCQVVHVQCREPHHDVRRDADEGRAFQGLDGYGIGDSLSDQIVQGPLGGRRAFRRRPAEDARPEDDDGTIGVEEGGGLCGWRGAQQGRRQRLWRRRGRGLRKRCNADCQDEAQHEPPSQTRQIAIPGSEAVRHAADSIRQ